MKRTILSTAVAASLGLAAAAPVNAAVIDATWTGWFTFLKSTGDAFSNTALGAYTSTYYGYRSPITGTFSYDTTTGAGSATITPFSFSQGGLTVFSPITLQTIGDGNCTTSGCGPGTLVLGNMAWTWGPNTAIPVSIVWDAAGFLGAIGPNGSYASASQTIDDLGVYAASENSRFGPFSRTSLVYPMGLLPIATTEYNTTDFTGNTSGCSWSACYPSGTLPLVTDTTTDSREDTTYLAGDGIGIGGSPTFNGPILPYSSNFDVDTIHITSVTPDVVVPVPAALWLFGSGLIGLASIVRRKKKA